MRLEKAHCRSGHALADANLYMDKGNLRCRTCRKARHEKWSKEKRRPKALAGTLDNQSTMGARGNRTGANYNFPKIRFCRLGHAIIGANIAIEIDFIRCRTCAQMKDRRRTKNGKLAEDVIRNVLLGLKRWEDNQQSSWP
jgi:hypothetical protein